MIIKIRGSKDYYFSDSIEPKERLIEINKMLEDILLFDGEELTVEEYFRDTWDKPPTKVALDKIGFYLSKMPEQNGRYDKEILSRNDELEMTKGVRWSYVDEKRVLTQGRYTVFSDLDRESAIEIGLIDSEDASFD